MGQQKSALKGSYQPLSHLLPIKIHSIIITPLIHLFLFPFFFLHSISQFLPAKYILYLPPFS